MGRRGEGVHRSKESNVFYQDVLRVLEMGAGHNRQSAVELGCEWGIDFEGEEEE